MSDSFCIASKVSPNFETHFFNYGGMLQKIENNFLKIKKRQKIVNTYIISDAGMWKTLGVPVVIGGDNLPSPVKIGLTDLPNIGPPVPAWLSHCEYIVKYIFQCDFRSFWIPLWSNVLHKVMCWHKQACLSLKKISYKNT